MPSPDAIAAEMSRVVKMAEKIADMAQAVVDEYAELDDGAHSPSRDSDGMIGTRHLGQIDNIDPTGNVAISPRHVWMREQLVEASGHFRRVRPHLERARTELEAAWTEQDSEYRAIKAIEREYSRKAQRRRTG